MRVALMTAGSRGDVAPYTGLGHGLARAGHEVTLVTHARFAPLAAAAGLGFHALPVDPRAEMATERGRALQRSATGVGKLAQVVELARDAVARMTDDLLRAAEKADVLLLSSSLAALGHTIGVGLSLPSRGVHLQPLAPTGAFAPPVIAAGSWGATANRLAGRAVTAAVDGIFADASRTVRTRLGLPPLGSRAARRARERACWPVHHGFSPLVVPRPADWRPGLTVDGYWWPYDPPGTELPPRVRDFLAAGPPPVFVGMGSATLPQPERLTATFVRALRAAGTRGIVQRGWTGLEAEGDDVLTVDELPHAVLFPHLAAVVHHAGAGTTAAALRAGVPAVPVPVQFDAGFWAARLTALGVSPGPVPLRRLTASALTDALVRATTDPSYRTRARALAARLREEDGVGSVVAAVNRLAGG
ncbi:glycosyltransferase [Streptomyces sp. I05A-00742]|uniref:glycosyltransferase n=1 Tax=Streptomyces sp. I05A-00742 TaxID=2732853 RepID=UPI0020177930|nr:glycosyltransferase [Streptomyces sp. I05A-00742]